MDGEILGRMEKIGEKNGRENDFCGCLVGEMKGEKTGGTYGAFSLGSPKINSHNCGWQGAKWKMTHLLLLCTR